MEDQTLSPLPPKEEEKKENNKMTFGEALQKIATGKKITRLEWENEEDYGILKDEILLIHKSSDDKMYKWTIGLCDIEGDDYYEI